MRPNTGGLKAYAQWSYLIQCSFNQIKDALKVRVRILPITPAYPDFRVTRKNENTKSLEMVLALIKYL